MPPLSRRQLINGLASLPIIAHLPGARAADQCGFLHGVASGDPNTQSVVLWTRISTSAPTATVYWELAAAPDFKQPTQRGHVQTNRYRDHTVKVIAQGLQPGQTYFYRFSCGQTQSIIGRTRTLPVGAVDQLGIALVSCSNFAFGHFHAYQAVADDPAIDIVLHTGDYIYEYGADSWGADVAQEIGRVHQPAHEIVTIADYRQRHAQYKTDTGSQAMHAAHPLIALWDDHESANNPWLGGAQNHQPETEGEWRSRRAAATQAYYEWMPIRPPADEQRRVAFWRSYSFGKLATLITLESRHTARAKQIDYGPRVDKIASPEAAAIFEKEVLNQSNRFMLSPDMEAFLAQQLKASKAQEQPWRLLGNAIPMARVRVPDLAAHGLSMPAGYPLGSADFVWKGSYNLPLYLDTWDGYPWARERFYAQCERLGVRDLMVLTGDSHSFWANALHRENGTAMGVEIGTAGVSSPGDFVEQGFDLTTAAQLDTLLAAHNDEVRWTDNLHQGYVRVSLRPDQATIDYVAVSTVTEPVFITTVVRSEQVERDDGSLRFKDV